MAGEGPPVSEPSPAEAPSSRARPWAALLVAAGIGVVAAALVGVFVLDEPAARSRPSDTALPTTSPAARSPGTPTPSPTLTPTGPASPAPPPSFEPGTESPHEFYALLSEAIRTGDARFLFERLHPVVLERYGESQCRTYALALVDPSFELDVVAVGETAPWTWELDGRSTVIDEAISVQIVIRNESGESAQESHLVFDGDVHRWFTDCGTPR